MSSENHAGTQQKSYRIMKVKIFSTLDKAKPTHPPQKMQVLNVAMIKRQAVQMTELT